MKRLAAILAFCSIGFLPGCAAFGIPTAETFNQRIAVGYAATTSVRDSATVLLNAKKISVSDAENVLKQTDNARSGLDIARAMFKNDPLAAGSKLDSVTVAIRALQTYLAGKQ